MNSSEQGAQHTATARRERASSCAAAAHIVELSICILTMVESLMAAGRKGARSHPAPLHGRAARSSESTAAHDSTLPAPPACALTSSVRALLLRCGECDREEVLDADHSEPHLQ